MRRLLKRTRKTQGQVPGELLFLGTKKVAKPTLTFMQYTQQTSSQMTLQSVSEIGPISPQTIAWLNVSGLHDTELIQAIGDRFGIHSLHLEDLLNVNQRPKIEEFDDYIFITCKHLYFSREDNRIFSDQISLIIGDSYILSFQESQRDAFTAVRARIEKSRGRIRKRGVDYLAYALLDTIVDIYLYTLERFGEQIEDLESDVLHTNDKDILGRIYHFRREMHYIFRSLRPFRESVIQLHKLDTPLISSKTTPFLKDLLDLSNQTIDAAETYKEMLSDYSNLYNSNISNAMNEVMKILTIFSAIFIPLTFIAGIYGTNFEHLPEVHYKYAYPIFWLVLVIVAGVMIRFFKKRNWF